MIFTLYFFIGILSCSSVFAGKSKSSSLASSDEASQHGDREGKLFSLFSIVQFKNEACTSSETLANTVGTVSRNGTCFSSTECRDKSGRAAGGCAAGFGVCCVFVYETTGSTITQNCSYIRNPNYPSSYGDTNSLQYTITKCDPSVCYLRLDFENFDINGLSDSTESEGTAGNEVILTCQDKFTISSAADPGLPEICGRNTGQHVYIDMGTGASDTTQLKFDFTDSTALANARFFEIKVTQLPCSNEYNRYPGCFQYHEGLTGRIETFNFQNCGNKQTHLPNQEYSICVRPEAGYDCVQWQVCPDTVCGDGALGNGITLPAGTPNTCTGFSVGVKNAMNAAPVVPKNCLTDKIRIDGASQPCCQGTNPAPQVDAMCGYFFTVNTDATNTNNGQVCDCIAPYNVEIDFDAMSDEENNAVNVASSCGICLIYNQVRC